MTPSSAVNPISVANFGSGYPPLARAYHPSTRRDRLPLKGRLQEVVVIEVSDTGRGIPADVQERLFDPFFTTKPVGTGLGLSIAMRILERHGGTRQFQTAPGSGTTFGVVLPLPPAERRVGDDGKLAGDSAIAA